MENTSQRAIGLSGNLDATHVRQVRDAILADLPPPGADNRAIVLDLREVTGVDLAGLQLLVSVVQWAEKHQCALSFANISDEIGAHVGAMGLGMVIG